MDEEHATGKTDALSDPSRKAQPADPSGQLADSYAVWEGADERDGRMRGPASRDAGDVPAQTQPETDAATDSL